MIQRYSAKYGISNIQSGESDSLFLPGGNAHNGYGVVLLHGAGTPTQFQEIARWASGQIPARLCEAGFACVSGQMGGDTFANDTAMTRIGQARTYLEANADVDPDKVILVGFSMGGSLAWRYAGLNPSEVAAIAGIMPLCDMDEIYQGNLGGLRAAIGTAWGVTYPTALPADAHPLTQYAAAITGANIPSRIYYSDADTFISTTSISAMGTALGTTPIEHDPTNAGHTETGFNNIGTYGDGDWSDLVDFCLSYSGA